METLDVTKRVATKPIHEWIPSPFAPSNVVSCEFRSSPEFDCSIRGGHRQQINGFALAKKKNPIDFMPAVIDSAFV